MRTTHRLFASSLLTVLAPAVVAVVTFASGAARASTSCAKASDCAKGLTCQTTGATACPDIGCAPNEVCANPPACNPTTVMECVPGPCSADSDCADGMVCFARAQTSCSSPAAPPCSAGVKCPPVDLDAGGCTSTTVKECVPRYVPPCHVDTDCGGGFTCVADQACWCSGSASGGSTGPGTATTPSSSGDDASGSPPTAADDAGFAVPLCGCTAQATSHCQAKTINCNVASECPALWACVQPPSAITGCAVSRSTDGGPSSTTCMPPTPVPVQSVCEPPYRDLGISQGFGAGESTGSAPPRAGDPTGTAGTASDRGAAGPGASSQGGCQLGSGPVDASAGAWLGLFGVAAFARRRRSQRA